jgi:hypothetical protein
MSQAPRPLQNRVDPFGELHAVTERGGMMGNRGGRLHRDDQTLSGSRWKTKHWLICVCEFKGRRRDVWGKYYTELFFLDEPTALAAAHRPCFECRRVEALAFRAAFRDGAPPSAPEMDEVLHRERLEGGAKRIWETRLETLPDGAMIADDGDALAVRGDALLPWSFTGYGAPRPRPRAGAARALTPPSILRALSAGYRPRWADPIWLPREGAF